MFEPSNSVHSRYQSSLDHPLARHGGQYKILSMIQPGARVLDIGCASGYLCAALKAKDCSVVGLDIDQDALQKAEEHCDSIILGDIEDLATFESWTGERFDYVVFGDVLEHLKRPDRALLYAKTLLNPNGQVIAAIPNIAYGPMRLKSLSGNFTYKDTGHLDKTHLRFFTRKTMVQLFEEQGYHVDRLSPTGPGSLVPFWLTLTAAKFVVAASPSSP